ncbi:MAG: AraC family transcriptional regulator [Lachnospiraceae bacterium]|nr:AraC family transcriptional regulator [Lachnospiraceae bacterium]
MITNNKRSVHDHDMETDWNIEVEWLLNQLEETYLKEHPVCLFSEIISCIITGDLTELEDCTQQKVFFNYYQDLLKNYPSLQQNLFFYLIGSTFTAALIGGMDVNRGVALSQKYFKKARDQKRPEDLALLNQTMLKEYTEEVSCFQKYNAVYHPAVKYTIQYIADHIFEKINFVQLSNACGYSLSRIQHLFLEQKGCSLKSYIRNEKIKKACFLLRYSQDSCAHISQKLSFSSQSWFTEQFKKELKMTPAQYRKKYQKSHYKDSLL